MRCQLLTAFCFCLYAVCNAQIKPLSTLPAYDCSLQKLMSILGKPTILLFPDGNKEVQPVIDEYCGVFGNNCTKKTNSQMVDSDYSKPVFIVGDIRKFTDWAKFKLPVQPLPGGFSLNSLSFTDSTDAFIFIDSMHIVVGGNSLNAIKDAQLAFTGGYDITVVEKGKITFFGNYRDRHFDWYNLQDLKKANYLERQSGSFGHIYVSRSYPDTIHFSQMEVALQQYILQFLSIYKIPMPVNRIDWFIHAGMQEYGMMSGLFGLTCPGNNSAGFSIRGEIHTNGYDLGLVKHEYSHYLFDNTIPQGHDPAFFIEGCVEYVSNFNDLVLFQKRLAIAKQYRDTLDYVDLIVRDNGFYGQYSSLNYSVCGIFVKYLIDHFGVDGVKAYCLAADKLVASKTIFKQDFPELVAGYKQWLGGL